jgi:diguanylate cyclase (GGDEF)-like protein/hemerythrin-like metal-binding protein
VEDAEGFVNKIHELYDHPQDHSHDTLHFKDGRIIERFSMPQYIDGEVAGRVWSFRDVSERKKMEQQVFHLAYYDALTNLPNRRLLMDRLNLAIASGKRKNLYGALMFLDLDNFKPLNDTHGHGAGDLLLVEVATRLKSCVRETDTVARFGGDEFVVMLNELGSNRAEATSQARIVAEKIHSSLAEPYWLSQGGNQINKLSIEHHCTTSVGVVVFHNHEGSLDDILNWADSAMYQAKEEGRNLIRFHTPQHSSDANWGDQAGTILRLNWHVSYECGEPAIDNAHRKLFELANILIEFMFTRKESTPRFTAALENLLAHVRHHFADEEAILARHQYVNLEKHALDHKKILEHALQLREAALSGRVSIGELVSFLADEVVAQHMLKTDREFYPLFKL